MPLFGAKHKSTQESVKQLQEGLEVLTLNDKDEKKTQKVTTVFIFRR